MTDHDPLWYTVPYLVTPVEKLGLVGVCRKCGSVVGDPNQHDAFHIALENTAFAQKESRND